ncbi:MAG: hypothetical protein ABJH98_12565 [Reichenbachiella sp.]|uniref:fibronectin type III domain-containing protein n=1 Tax=Reichenbachiella sp. TaxID=2184521 RepID=UPI00329A541B
MIKRLPNQHGKKILIALTLLMVLSLKLRAQESQVLVINDPANAEESYQVLIKWYTPDFIYPEGVNLYRRLEGGLQWEKLNTNPIKVKDSIKQIFKQADPDLEFFEQLLQRPEEAKEASHLFINMIIKSFQSSIFADYAGIYFEDKSARWGSTYEYRVNRILKGKEILLNISNPIKVGQFEPDIPVKEIEVSQNKKSIELDWLPEENRFYAINIYKTEKEIDSTYKVNNKPMMLTQVMDSGKLVYPSPKFIDDKLSEGQTYSYEIAGIGFFGEEFARTEPVVVPFRDTTPPAPPEELKVDADSMKVHLEWQSLIDSDVVGFHVFRSVKSDGPFERVTDTLISPLEVEYMDLPSIPGPYYYYVASLDLAGNEASSRLVFVEVADVKPPNIPNQLSIKVDSSGFRLDWAANEEEDLWGYILFRAVEEGEEYVPLNVEPIQDNFFKQELSKNVKSTFFYKILAIDTAYNKSEVSEPVYAHLPDVMPPEKPMIRQVEPTENSIRVEWIPNVDQDLMGYHMYRQDSSISEEFKKINLNLIEPGVHGFTDRQIVTNRTYAYCLTALDSVSNESDCSNIEYGYLYKERTLEEVGKLKYKYNARKNNILIWWNEEPSQHLVGYVMFSGATETEMRPVSGLLVESNFTDTSPANAPTVFYKVKAVSKTGSVVYSELMSWKNRKYEE